MQYRSLHVLLVDDSAADVRLTREAMDDADIPCVLHVASDGVEGLAFLRRQGRYAQVPRPDLVLLDLNMPRMDGRAVLAETKTDQRLRSIPIVVLTTSDADHDIAACYEAHCNCYVVKPVELDGFLGVVQAVLCFWSALVRLPAAEAADAEKGIGVRA